MTRKREYKQKIAHIIEIVKKNPQLRAIRNQLIENEDDLDLDNDSPTIIGRSNANSRSQISAGNKFNNLNKGGLQYGSLVAGADIRDSYFKKNNSVALKMVQHLNELKLTQAFNDA